MSVIVQKTRTKTIDSHSSHSAQTPWGPQVHEKHKNKVITKMNTRTVTVAPKATTLQEKEEPSWIFHSTRFVAIALPFISRYKPLGNTFSLATGSVRILFSLQQVLSSIQKGDSSAIPLHLANACVATFAVA